MTSQKPPRPSKPPSRKETVEVQLEWLEEAGTKLKAKSKLPPPPLPNARVQAPPMPVTPSNPPPARSTKPPPRNPPTLEVDMRELIIVPTMPVPPFPLAAWADRIAAGGTLARTSKRS